MNFRWRKEAASSHFEYGAYGFISDRGLNPRRVTNEDSLLLMENVPLFAVADGVGGQNAGEVASQVTVELLNHYFSQQTLPEEKIEFLDRVIRHANRYLHDMACDDELLSGMATTLAVILLDEHRAILGHVGDSRVYRFTSGTLHRETIDHTIAEEMSSPGGREFALNKNMITRALGVDPDLEPETRVISVPPDTTFLLCTDGVTRHLSDSDLTAILNREPDPQTVCNRLKDLCYQRGARDNLTAIVVKLKSDSFPALSLTGKRTTVVPRPDPDARPRAARIRVPVGNRDQRAPQNPLATGEAASTPAEAVSGEPTPETEPMKGATLRRLWSRNLFLMLALMIGFLAGLYVQQEFAPPRFDDLLDPLEAPGRQAFEEGRRAFQAGNYARALEAFSTAVEQQHSLVEAQHWLGKTRFAMGDYQNAAAHFRQAASVGGPADNYLFEAAAYGALGNMEKARESLKAYLDASHE